MIVSNLLVLLGLLASMQAKEGACCSLGEMQTSENAYAREASPRDRPSLVWACGIQGE